MNGVIGSLDLLDGEELPGSAATYLALAHQSAREMVEMIDHLLSFNPLNVLASGEIQYSFIELRPFLHSIIVEQRPLFTRKKLELSLQLPEDLPQNIWTDREKLGRLFEILLGNARKFTEHGRVTLSVSRTFSSEEGEMLHCSVTDSGIGIPEGMLEKIFEPFVQGDGSLTRRFEGVGLGLAIARQNALLLNGHLRAEHVAGGGSCFTVTLKVTTP
jgi:signal transduction histidine kinase